MSIEGRGDIALALKDKVYFTLFASGVSNSQETRESEYQREKDLLLKQDTGKRLVYFSSLSIFYTNPDTRYTRHKKEMETLVKKNFPKYCIIRLGNIVGGKNPHTLINFLKDKIEKGEPFEVRDEYRYIVHAEELQHWVDRIPLFNCEINIPGEMLKVSEIVERIKNSTI